MAALAGAQLFTLTSFAAGGIESPCPVDQEEPTLVVCGISPVHSKCPEVVTTAPNLRLREQKVQKAPVNGYWKLNVWLGALPVHAGQKRKRPDSS